MDSTRPARHSRAAPREESRRCLRRRLAGCATLRGGPPALLQRPPAQRRGSAGRAVRRVRAGPDKGARHEFRNALAGGLGRAGWQVDDIANFVGAVARVSGHADVEDAKTAARTSVEKVKAGEQATGWKRVGELCGDKG